jgi:hypothetical protein
MGLLAKTRYKCVHYIKLSARKGVESDVAQDVGLVNSMINFQVSQNTGNIFAS